MRPPSFAVTPGHSPGAEHTDPDGQLRYSISVSSFGWKLALTGSTTLDSSYPLTDIELVP